MNSSQLWVLCRVVNAAKDAVRLVRSDGVHVTETFFTSNLQKSGPLSLSWEFGGDKRNYTIINVSVNTGVVDAMEATLSGTPTTQLVDTSGAPCIVVIKSKPGLAPEIEFFSRQPDDSVTNREPAADGVGT